MTPEGVGCTVKFVNATKQSLVVGAAPAGFKSYGSYQMAAWFSNPSTLAPAGGTGTGFAQFKNGVGDEDDSANLPVSFGNSTDASYSLFQIFGATIQKNSVHHMYLKGYPGTSVPSRCVLGLAPDAAFESTPPGAVQWFQLNGQTSVELGFPPTLSLIVADLSQIYDSVTAGAVYNAIGSGSLSGNQVTDLYAQVIGYCYPELTTLSFALSQVSFANAPNPGQASGSTVVGSQTFSNPAGVTAKDSVSMSKQIAQSFTLSSSKTWGTNVEVGFSIPLPFNVGLDASISGSFACESGEQAVANTQVEISVTAEVDLPPGDWNVTAYAVLADNYTASFSGVLEITGTIAVPVVSGPQPLNGNVLTCIMQNGDRNLGSQLTQFTPGPNLTSANVSGTISGAFAVNSSIVTTPINK